MTWNYIKIHSDPQKIFTAFPVGVLKVLSPVSCWLPPSESLNSEG